MRTLMLVLSLAMTSAVAAPPKHPPKTAPPTEPAPPPQDIDVDAMARAKDANAAAPTAEAAPADANAAAATATPEPQASAAAPPAPESPVSNSSAAAKPASAGVAAEAPALTKPAIDPQEQRIASGCASRATNLLDAAQKGDFAGATKDFDAKMRSALPAAKFKQIWESLSQFGALQARGEAHPGKGEGYYFVMTPLIFEKTTLVAQIPCGSDGLIAGFNVKPLAALQP